MWWIQSFCLGIIRHLAGGLHETLDPLTVNQHADLTELAPVTQLNMIICVTSAVGQPAFFTPYLFWKVKATLGSHT